jgi:hypothetical protein
MKSIIVPKRVHVIIHDRKYYSAFINERQHVYSFVHVDSAKRCSKFLAEFKQKYNVFPMLDDLRSIVPIKRIKDYTDEMYIEQVETEELQCKCLTYNIGLIGVSSFDYKIEVDKITVDFEAADLLPDDKGTRYIQGLETLLDM